MSVKMALPFETCRDGSLAPNHSLQQVQRVQRAARLYTMSSGTTWPGWRHVTTVICPDPKVAVPWCPMQPRLPKSLPKDIGSDAILQHFHLRCPRKFVGYIVILTRICGISQILVSWCFMLSATVPTISTFVGPVLHPNPKSDILWYPVVQPFP